MWGYGVMAGLQLYQGYTQAVQMETQGQITKRLADMNAAFLEIDAYETEKFGHVQAAQHQSTVDQTIGSQRTAMAAADVDVSFGTAADIQTESRITGLLNIIDIKNAARQKARGIRNEASNVRLGGQMAALQANMDAGSTRLAAGINAAGTGLKATGYGKAFKSDTED